MASFVVAIVGRSNVGKSALFNKIAGRRISIVDKAVGVTRDRIFASCRWLGFEFDLVDTCGLEFKSDEKNIEFLNELRNQIKISIDRADVLVFVVDLHCGITNIDFEISNLLKKSKKPVVVCVNKCDVIGDLPAEFYDFYGLGFDEIFAVSAIHGHGLGDFLDCVVSYMPKNESSNFCGDRLKIAIIGRPNVGKSSILNKLLGENRTVVSNLAGTTRDSVDVEINRDGENFVLIDTAGIVKKSNKISDVERYSLLRSYMAIERADVCVTVVDGVEGLLENDVKIAGYAHEKGKGCLILVNKIDLLENKAEIIKKFDEKLKLSLNFMGYFKHVYVSAKTGQRLNKVFEMASAIQIERKKRLSTGVLNDLVSLCVGKVPPSLSIGGKRLKIYYATQVGVEPPTFAFFVNKAELFHFSYRRYLENQIRLAFGFFGTPIKILVRERKND